MLVGRYLVPEDMEMLSAAIAEDSDHQSTAPEFFTAPNTMTNVYEDDNGPVLFMRVAKAMRIDMQFMDNRDFKRNRDILIAGFPLVLSQAKAAGFSELIFNTNSTLLQRFCERQFGFRQSAGELRLHI